MIKILRSGILLLLFALAVSFTLQPATAQMMHFTLNVVVETEDGSPIPAGQVCVSGEVDPICIDIPADTPSGREFSFPDLADGDHEVTVSAEPYLEAVGTVTLTENVTTVTFTLQMEQTPPSVLPNTGTGAPALAGSSSALPMLLLAGGLACSVLALSFAPRRRQR